MDQTFIRVKKANGNYINKDIKDSTYQERYDWYQTLSKGQVMVLVEKLLNQKKC